MTTKTKGGVVTGSGQPKYPEHEKLAKISDRSQAIGDFLEWLRYTKHLDLGRPHDHEESGCEKDQGAWECELYTHEFDYNMIPVVDLLAEYFKIDQQKIEREKDRMLKEIRKGQQTVNRKWRRKG